MHSIDKSYMEPVAQWVERQFVALVVAGSNPVGLPNRYHGFTVIQKSVRALRRLPSRKALTSIVRFIV